jgi:hypothetical protein
MDKTQIRVALLAAFDNTQAEAEGWALFNDGELQRLDEGPVDLERGVSLNGFAGPVFANDMEAFGFVCVRAALGSDYHKMALECVSREWLIRSSTNYSNTTQSRGE